MNIRKYFTKIDCIIQFVIIFTRICFCSQVDLDKLMDTFFNTLYQKMFTVLNSQYRFDNKYLECVSQHMKNMRPFGDIPQKLGVQIKRSFVATRAFSQALQIGTEVLKNMQQVCIN